MSSLSQEDLDAGWDDAEIGAARPTVPVDPNTIPPTSMIREKQPAELASGVVPASEQVLASPVLLEVTALSSEGLHAVPATLDCSGAETAESSSLDDRAAGSTAEVVGFAPLETASEIELDAKQLETQPTIDAKPSGAATSGNEPAAAVAQQRTAVKRSVRWLVWSGAALLAVAIGYSILLRSKHANTRVKSASPLTVGEVHPPTQDREPSGSEGAVARAVAVPGSASTVQSPGGASRPVSESFSDAFVKHAATVNSNWAEVKKRPRAAETQSASRPKSGVNASGENPLGVLDQLEKARKAKRTTSSQP